MELKIAVAGLGLIGGSLAKALKKYTGCKVTGFDRDSKVLKAALESGAIDGAGNDESLRVADVLYLCLYPQGDIDFINGHLSSVKKKCIVTDTCGIKSSIFPALSRAAEENGFTYVGGHPMAGKEKSGFAASDAELFKGASYILVPGNAPKSAVGLLKDIALSIGFGGTVETTPGEHDRMIAFTSQLPHVLACAYVMSPQCPKHKGFSAGSYHDVSRVARINEDMWTELFIDNKKALVEELDTLTGSIAEIRDAVAGGDAQKLRELLRKARIIKERLGE